MADSTASHDGSETVDPRLAGAAPLVADGHCLFRLGTAGPGWNQTNEKEFPWLRLLYPEPS